MHDFNDLLTPATVRADVSVAHRKAAFAQVGAVAAAALPLSAEEVAGLLAERERLGSTAFGHGIAIPHARVEGIAQVHGVFLRTTRPIDMEAADDLPVDLIFALLSPPAAGAEHLKALARVSRALRDPGFRAKLRGAGSSDALYALLAGVETRDAA